jgi:hypothetical protein
MRSVVALSLAFALGGAAAGNASAQSATPPVQLPTAAGATAPAPEFLKSVKKGRARGKQASAVRQERMLQAARLSAERRAAARAENGNKD